MDIEKQAEKSYSSILVTDRHSVSFGLVSSALFGLIVFDLIAVVGNFSRLHEIVRRFPVRQRNSEMPMVVEEVCRAVDLACSVYPKHALCLQRSAVTTCLLRHHSVPARMVIGLKRFPFSAHAWVEVRGIVVNDRLQLREVYQILECC